MLKKISLFFSILLLTALVIYGHRVRSIGYYLVPENYNLLDERTNVWHGLSIRSTGVPAAWSDLRTYWEKWPENITENEGEEGGLELKGFNIAIDGQGPRLFPRNFPELKIFTTNFNLGVESGDRYTSIVQPYLDHPPFGALVLSSLVSPRSGDINTLTPYEFRKTSIWLGSLTAVLVFIFALQLTNNPFVALIASIVYETAPTYLLTSRLALLENVFIPLSLISLNILVYAIKKKAEVSFKYKALLILSGIVAGLVFLTKTPGISIIIAGFLILLFNKEKFKNTLFFTIPAFFVASFYFLWGFILAPHIFPKLLLEQSSARIFVGSLGFLQQMFKYGMESFPIDGWWFGGFLTMLFLKFDKNTTPLIITILTLIFTIPFTGASSFPWYFIPLIPFASISSGIFIWELLVRPKILSILIFFFVFFSSSYFWAVGAWSGAPDFKNHQQEFLIYKIFLGLTFISGFLVHFYHKKSPLFRNLWLIGMIIIFIFLIWLNFKSFYYILSHWTKLIENYSPNWIL